ncbi:hypothetical protein Desgi_1060 [Desulfoscipio gibsoniae DSM 7213]|uniref:Uncharacterized protein n=1 Tax=Desulfoscipio gibsoniae DSM 7213 TaxID=767817 RepID=R4KDD5_9FIRM|nr:hypothetical protein Desgi_1060 [Desulfoscipio gibsoniae DSM 7213]
MEKSKYSGIIPQKLLTDIKNGKCILFVGSGLSSQVKRSNDKNLIKAAFNPKRMYIGPIHWASLTAR